MATVFKSDWAKGLKAAPVSREARGVVVETFTYTFDEAVAAEFAIGDIVELAILPAYHTVVDAVMINEALGTSVTGTVGIMSGDVGEEDNTRTSGAEIYSGTDLSSAAVTRPTIATAFTIAPADKDRSIGFKVGGAKITAAGQKVTLILRYAQ